MTVEQSLKRRADAVLRDATEAGDVPGVVAMATDREGTLYEGAFGKRALGQPAPMTLDTVVWIASMTKALTGAAVMQLVEQGRLDLESPAARWVPELEQQRVLEGFDASGEPKLRPPKRPITLRHLLTHTAGFGYEMWNAPLLEYQRKTGLPPLGTGKLAALKSPLLFDPGERWNYGINIDWAGRVVEAVSGRRLGETLRESLFAPLEMNDTGYKLTPALRMRLAKVHQRDAAGTLHATDREMPQDAEFDTGGGGLYSTAGDYLKFVRMILNRGRAGGRQVLGPRTVDLMSRNQMGDTPVTLLKTCLPERSNDAEFFPGSPKRWGLTFMINMEPAPTGRSAGSLAWAGLGNTYYWIDPAKGLGGVYLTQILPFVDRKSLPLYYAFETAVYRAA
ncbi:MAG: serine hydrolase domain-containing protein [SAR324 cluster bacterium]